MIFAGMITGIVMLFAFFLTSFIGIAPSGSEEVDMQNTLWSYGVVLLFVTLIGGVIFLFIF